MNKKNQKYYILAFIAALLLAGSFLFSKYYASKPGNYDDFATCINKSGAKFYGAFWCPHCEAQKALFGKSKEKLPYVECSTANGQDQTQVCKDKKIESYPTWEFIANGTTTLISGEKTFEDFAKYTNCPLPAEYVSPVKMEKTATSTIGEVKIEAVIATATKK